MLHEKLICLLLPFLLIPQAFADDFGDADEGFIFEIEETTTDTITHYYAIKSPNKTSAIHIDYSLDDIFTIYDSGHEMGEYDYANQWLHSSTSKCYVNGECHNTEKIKKIGEVHFESCTVYFIKARLEFVDDREPLIAYTDATTKCLAGDELELIKPIKSNGGCADCTPPTLGYDSNGYKKVDNGVCINDSCMDGGYFHTDYPIQSTTINHTNTISLKYYENNGPSNIQMIQLGIGVKEIGSPLSQSQAVIEVWLNPFKGDMYNPTIQEIIIVDPDEILAYTDGTVELVQCMDDSTNEFGCLQTDFSYSYAKPPSSPILVTNAMDIPRNAINNYINDGLSVIHFTPEIVELEKEEYVCDDPITSVMTRNNCHFREQTLLWK